MDLTEFLNEFQLEAGEKLDVIASQLLRLERDATNLEPVREMFLAAHTIKGGAAMMRLTEVEALAHATEDLLSAIRDRQRVLDGPTADLLFQAIDRLRGLISAASGDSVGREPDEDLVRFARALRTGSPGETTPEPTPQRAVVLDESRTVRELHRMLLEDAGYEVETYDDPLIAVERAVTSHATLVVAGASSGWQMCADLASSPTRVVLTSADADEAMRQRAADNGAHALVRRGSLRESELTSVLAALRQPA